MSHLFPLPRRWPGQGVGSDWGAELGVVLKVLELLTNGNFFMVQILSISSFKHNLFRRELAFFFCVFFFLSFAMDG